MSYYTCPAEAMGAWAVLDISEGRSADAAAALCSAQEGQEALMRYNSLYYTYSII